MTISEDLRELAEQAAISLGLDSTEAFVELAIRERVRAISETTTGDPEVDRKLQALLTVAGRRPPTGQGMLDDRESIYGDDLR